MAGLLAKPRHLALGIVPCIALRIEDGFVELEFAIEKLHGLAIAVRFKWLDRRGEASRQNFAHFLDQAGFEHLRCAPVELFIESLSRGRETDLENSVSSKRLSSLLEQLGHRAAGHQTDFDSTCKFGKVARMNAPGGFRIEAAKQADEGNRVFGARVRPGGRAVPDLAAGPGNRPSIRARR